MFINSFLLILLLYCISSHADIHEVMVEVIGNTAILWNRITLLAVVGSNEVTTPFMVTEVYVKESNIWKLADLTFSKLLSRE